MQAKTFLCAFILFFLQSSLSAQEKYIEYVGGLNISQFFELRKDIYYRTSYPIGLGFNFGVRYQTYLPEGESIVLSLQLLQQSGGEMESFGHRFWSSYKDIRFTTYYMVFGIYVPIKNNRDNNLEFDFGFEALCRIAESAHGVSSSYNSYTGERHESTTFELQTTQIPINLFTSVSYPIPTNKNLVLVPKWWTRIGLSNRLRQSSNVHNLMIGLELGLRYQLKKSK
ncbi:MAG: hypothetical protein R3E32_23350 [Chitinophagales bacterium]